MECEAPGPSSGHTRSRPSRPPRPAVGIQTFVALKQCHDEAHRLVQKGLAADEVGNVAEAIAFYEKGLRGLSRGLGFNCDELDEAGPDEKDVAKTMHQKMRKTKLQIEYRLEELMRLQSREVPSAPDLCEEPPSYEDSMSESQFSELGDSIMGSPEASGDLHANATELFSIQAGVQIFYITPEGYVSAPSYPSPLKIFKFNETEITDGTSPPAFLKVGDWVYPLVPGTSPALQTNYGGYVFPDTTAGAPPGSSVGLILPETVSVEERRALEDVMSSLSVLREQEASPMEVEPTPVVESEIVTPTPPRVQEGPEVTPETSTSSKISKGILIVADYMAWGVGKGAEKAGHLIKFGSEKIRARMSPAENPRPIDPKVQKGVQYVRQGTHAAVSVSSYLVGKLGQATMALAREVAPHIRSRGEKLLPKSLKEPSPGDGKSKMDGALEVAASGLKGFGTVYMSLEAAAKVLGRNLSKETAGIVTHKYGPEAGQLTEHTLFSAGNVVMTAHNANNFGVKAIAKRAAKDAGKAVLEDLAEKRKQKRPDQPPDMH